MIKDMPVLDKPREKAIINGVQSLTDAELLAILIRTGTKNKSSLDLAHQIINLIGNIKDTSLLTLERLSHIKGLGKTKAITILSALEFGKRSLKQDELNIKILKSVDIYNYFKYHFFKEKQELLIVAFLGLNKQLISFKKLYQGTINYLAINTNDLLKEAILHSSKNIILIHNHPSGSIYPSKEDLDTTKNLIAAGKIFNIKVIDHLIITDNNYYSFRDNGDI